MRKVSVVPLIIAGFFLLASAVYAHQPRIVTEEKDIQVSDPEISQAFYGELKGTKNVYEIRSDKPFELYVDLLVPDIAGARKDFYAEIYKQEDKTGEGGVAWQTKTTVALLDGTTYDWTKYYEPFGGDDYLKGPEFKDADAKEVRGRLMDAGNYYIGVFNPDNEGKYVLAIGTVEKFALKDILETMKTLPALKTGFFGKSPIAAIFQPIGVFSGSFILIILIIAWLIFRKTRKTDGFGIKMKRNVLENDEQDADEEDV